MIINIKNYNINYIDENSNSKEIETIVFLHGWGSSYKVFNNLINIVKNKYRVVALDLVGHGDSSNFDKGFSVDDYVDIIQYFLEKLEIKNVILVGHSYGGRIIIKLNSIDNLKFNISKNILIDSAGIKRKLNLITRIRIIIFKLLKKISNISFIKKNFSSLEEILINFFGSTDYNNLNKFARETVVKAVNEDLTPLLKNMRETLLIWGENDEDTPLSDGKIMENTINNSGLVIIKNAGHFSFIDDSFTVSKVFMSYLNI